MTGSYHCLLLIALGFTACTSGNGDSVLNTGKGERVLTEWLDKQGMEAVKVTCPPEVQKGKDISFACQVQVENADELMIEILVTQRNDKGDVRFALSDELVISNRIERGLVGQIYDQTKENVRADCGLRVRPAKRGSFTCQIQSVDKIKASSDFEMRVTILDDSGRWEAAKL